MEHPDISKKRSLSPIWSIPIVALLIGIWMVAHTYMTRGPEIEIQFATAEGIEVGKTKIRLRAVTLGTVESIELADDLAAVTVRARLQRFAKDLLREDTQFWVVKPKLGPSGVSGLSTLLSGPYIEMAPGASATLRQQFRGLDDIPVTPPSTPGIHLELFSPNAAALGVGKPILYRGYTVGRIETATLDPATGGGRYGIFINAPYNDLVTSSTRFWNASGLSLGLSADGVSVKTESLEALISGGVAFDVPTDAPPGMPVASNTQFELFPDYESINEHAFRFHKDYLLMFDTSVRGLRPGAPVEYRGIRIGTVIGASFDYADDEAVFAADGHIRVPVLVRLDPGRINIADSEDGRAEFAAIIEEGVTQGLRATLRHGSLVTGQLFVALDFFDDVAPAEIETHGAYAMLPTESTGLEQIENKVAAVLDQILELPLDNAIANLADAARSASDALNSIDQIMQQPEMAALPDTVAATLVELRQTLDGFSPGSPVHTELEQVLTDLSGTLAGLDDLSQTLSAKPSALVFSRPRGPDPEPGSQSRSADR